MMRAIIGAIRSHRRQIHNIALIVLGLGAFAIIGLIVVALLIGSAFAGLGDMFDSPICEPTNPSGIESVAQFELPPSMSNLRSNCGGMQGWWASAYFDMKPSDLNVFVSSTKVKLPLSTSGKVGTLKCYACNDFRNTRSYLYGTYSANEWFEEIFINTSNPAQWRVYFTLRGG